MSMTLTAVLNLVGKLDDSPGSDTPRERFRGFLKNNITEVGILRDYIEECLRNTGDQYNRAFQDLVNHLGTLMGFEVEFGRYQGTPGEIEGERKRIAKSAINKFYDALKERIVHSQLIHSRMLIVDDKQLLVSSADLTTDQLYDEFNAGIWTSDKEAVEKATAFFENIFQLEQSRKAEKNPKT